MLGVIAQAFFCALAKITTSCAGGVNSFSFKHKKNPPYAKMMLLAASKIEREVVQWTKIAYHIQAGTVNII